MTNLSDEEMTQARWAAGDTLSRSWERLHQLGVVTETTTACLPNPPPPDLSIEDHLFECLDRLRYWLSAVQEIHASTFTEFLSAHFQARWSESRNGPTSPPCIHPPKDVIKAKKGVWRRGLKDLMGWITRGGRDHAYGGLLSGGFIPEEEGAGGGSSPNGAEERADVGDGDGIHGDWLVLPSGDRSPGDLSGRTEPRPS